MIHKSSDTEKLIYLFSKLPGIGIRSARRIVLHLLQDKEVRLKELINGLTHAAANIITCSLCNNIDYFEVCTICSDRRRDDTIIMVVESVADLWAFERGNIFDGKYYILGGNLSAINAKYPSDLKLDNLLSICNKNNVKEIVVATNSTVDGETTAYFVAEYFKEHNLKISRLASGIPLGGELDYLDDGTLLAAFESRRLLK